MFLSLAQPTVLCVLLLSLLLFAGTSFTSSVKHSKQLLKSHKKLMIKNRVHSGAEEKVVVVEGGGGSVPPSVPPTNDSPNESKEEAQAEVIVTAPEMVDQNDDLWFDPQKKNPPPGQKVQPRKNVKLILFGPSSTAEKLAVLEKIIADDGDPKLSVLRKKAALYKEALEVEEVLKRGGGGSTVSLKQAQADVKMAAFELRTVWQRLARTSGKVLQSKWAWGAGAIAGGLAIRQGYNQYLEKLARGEKGSYVKGHLNQNPVPPINNELAEGEGGPPLLLSPSPNSNAADGSGSLLFGGVIFALLVLLCACCGCYVLYNAVNSPNSQLNQFNLIRAGGGGKGGRGGGEGYEPSTSTGGTSRNKSRSSGRRRHSA